jgi:hypothetical protein
LHFIYIFFSTNINTEYFKHAAHTPFFFFFCRLFHNAAFFVSCIIHILHTGVLKFKSKLGCQKVNCDWGVTPSLPDAGQNKEERTVNKLFEYRYRYICYLQLS